MDETSPLYKPNTKGYSGEKKGGAERVATGSDDKVGPAAHKWERTGSGVGATRDECVAAAEGAASITEPRIWKAMSVGTHAVSLAGKMPFEPALAVVGGGEQGVGEDKEGGEGAADADGEKDDCNGSTPRRYSRLSQL